MTTKDEVEAFKGHRLWAISTNVIEAARNANGRTTTDRYTIARAISVARYVKSFRPIEPYLFGSQRVSQAEALAVQSEGVYTQLAGWDQAAAMLPATVQAIDACCDQVLSYITDFKWPSGRRGTDGDAFFASAEAYREAADGSLKGIAEQIAAAQERLVELEDQAKALAEASSARAIEAESALLVIKGLNDVQTTNAANYLKEAIAEVKSKAASQRATLADDAAASLKSLEDNKKSGNELIAQVADQAVGGGYLDFAKAEKRAYGWWNAIAISSALVAFGYLVFVFQSNQHDVEGAVLRVGISLTMVGLSAYAFREASKRQRQSVEAHYRALDVLALPPFSNGLSEDQGERLRYLMGERLFGSHVETGGRANKAGDALNLAIDPATVKAVTDAYRAAKAAGIIS